MPSIDTQSGKDAAYENFPVGSWLLPAHLRPHIQTFYNFARTIDDIADSPELHADEKINQLNFYASVLKGDNDLNRCCIPGLRMRKSLLETNIKAKHCLDLIDAFKQDAIKNRYRDWNELMDYCARSAAPVGRYLLDLHGDPSNGYVFSDALCNALQVINHLQDCKDDYQALDRVYLPQDWMNAEGMLPEFLGSERMTPPVRRVIDRIISATENLLNEAWELPGCLLSRRLAMESSVILRIADRLILRLRNEDPLNSRVKLTKPDYFWQILRGALPALFRVSYGRG